MLLLNTCGERAIAGLADAARVLREETLPARGTGEHLMPAIRHVLGGLPVRELAAICVVTGPGSFTGVRVGLSAAKGLCEVGGVGMIAVSRLALVAAHAAETLALLDAGRGEFFCGLYRDGDCEFERLLGRDETLEAMQGRPAITCEPRVQESLGDAVVLLPEPGVEAMFAYASARLRAAQWSDVAAIDANYLRRTDAELKQAAR